MPLVDKPLPELLSYVGINPRPVDHDSYWSAALAELDATPFKYEFVPVADFSAKNTECFDLWFDGVDGARVHAKYFRPRGAKNAPAVLHFHGYSSNAGDWFDKLAWTGEGFCVAVMDCRGQGGLSEDKGGVQGNTLRGHIVRGLDDPDPQKLLFRSIFLDTAQLARIVMNQPEVDATRVATAGGSQGGALSLACAALEPRIARAVTVFPFLCDYQRVMEMDPAPETYREIKDYFRLFDPLHRRRKDIFTKLGYIDVQHLAPRIRAKTLMITGLMDTICPPSSQFAAYNKITAPKDYVLYPDFGHEILPGHYDLIFKFLKDL
jgi:cephalosporin-C deacetylase